MPDFSSPFMPELGSCSPSVPQQFELNSAVRAEQRKLFEEKLQEEAHRRELIRQAQAAQEQRNEEEMVKLFRKQTEFKARPLPRSSQPLISRSTHSLQSRLSVDSLF